MLTGRLRRESWGICRLHHRMAFTSQRAVHFILIPSVMPIGLAIRMIMYLLMHTLSTLVRHQSHGLQRSILVLPDQALGWYRSVANTSAEIRWICNLLTELGIALPSTPVIYCDNLVLRISVTTQSFTRGWNMHVALDYYFIRGQIQHGMLRVSHVNTRDQLADALTKQLPRSRFQELCNKIGVVRAPSSWGGVLRILDIHLIITSLFSMSSLGSFGNNQDLELSTTLYIFTLVTHHLSIKKISHLQ